MLQEKIVFIKARMRGDDYISDGISSYGYEILIPYKDHNLFLRLFREAWFRLHLPFKRLFFNGKIKKSHADVFVVMDSLVCSKLLKWIHKYHPESKIVLYYENRADKSTFSPKNIDRSYVKVFTYDVDDSKKYHMSLSHAVFLECYRLDLSQYHDKNIDILYLGRDKGRGDYLLGLEKEFNKLNLKTHFHICADRAMFSKKKNYYQPLMSYRSYLDLCKHSKAILNIMNDNQTSITQRDLECVFDNIKCIVNNKEIKNFDLYDPSRFFILGEDDLSKLPEFLNTPLKR